MWSLRKLGWYLESDVSFLTPPSQLLIVKMGTCQCRGRGHPATVSTGVRGTKAWRSVRSGASALGDICQSKASAQSTWRNCQDTQATSR
jgi:hypothetical protein